MESEITTRRDTHRNQIFDTPLYKQAKYAVKKQVVNVMLKSKIGQNKLIEQILA